MALDDVIGKVAGDNSADFLNQQQANAIGAAGSSPAPSSGSMLPPPPPANPPPSADALGNAGREAREKAMNAVPPSALNLPPPPKVEKVENANPFMDFGKWGGMLALMGSFLTRAPLTTALTSAAAGVNATKKMDADTYAQAHQSWKDNTDYAIKLAEYQNNRYKAITSNEKLSVDEMSAQLRAEAAANHDNVMMQMKTLQEQVSLSEFRQRLTEKVSDARDRLNEKAEEMQEKLDLYRDRLDEMKRHDEAVEAQKSAGKPLSIEQQHKNVEIMQAQDYMQKLKNNPTDKKKMEEALSSTQPTAEQKQMVRQAMLANSPLYTAGPATTPIPETPSLPQDPGEPPAPPFGVSAAPSVPPTPPNNGVVAPVKNLGTKPQPVPVPADQAHQPDGMQFKNNGWIWTKQGGQMVPTQPDM